MGKHDGAKRNERAPAPGGVSDDFGMGEFWHASRARERRIAARVVEICRLALKDVDKRKVMEND